MTQPFDTTETDISNRRLSKTPSPTTATRADALARLATFVPHAGRTYAAKRNTDYGPGANVFVSGLSSFIRHRMITEQEVISAVLAKHSLSAADKFIQEVCWRTYWKGWLEQRPDVWAAYLQGMHDQRAALHEDHALAAEVAAAERGETGNACFDAWARELIAYGYLHNHARMWFASLWIFTLKLPWQLGADFFLRHLLDGDPASNTLSWRWVAGLHTRGKTYLARADNIETHTNGRFKPQPEALARVALPLSEAGDTARVPLPKGDVIPAGARVLLLVTEDDLTPELWPVAREAVMGAMVLGADDDGPAYGAKVRTFKTAALADVQERASAHFGLGVNQVNAAHEITAALKTAQADFVVTPYVPVGPNRDRVSDLTNDLARDRVQLRQFMLQWDAAFWPHATAGFFKVKDRIPRVLEDLDLTSSS
jgi:deoxyribodipyrimidine photo-lyase